MFNSDALSYLIRCKERLKEVDPKILNKRWVGRGAESWFETVNNSSDLDWYIGGLSTSPLDRCKLQKKISGLRSSKTISDEDIKMSVIEIFAWGGMRMDHARMVLPCIENYQDICKDLLCSKLNSDDAYKNFHDAHHSGMFKGMGPPFYTKLIYFLGDHSGLILDQWTARSINKLCDKPVIKLTRNKNGSMAVRQSNGPKHYKIYLEIVEELRAELKLDTLPLSKTEELIFSCSDRDPRVINRLGQYYHRICSAWRKYVRTEEQVLTADE